MKKYIRRFIGHCRRTWKNKLCALILIACGLGIKMIDGDGTILVITSILSVALIFAKENWME